MVNGITIDNLFVLGPGLNSVLPADGHAVALGTSPRIRQSLGHAVAGQVGTHQVRSGKDLFLQSERTGVYLLTPPIRTCSLGRARSLCAAAGQDRPRSWPAAV